MAVLYAYIFTTAGDAVVVDDVNISESHDSANSVASFSIPSDIAITAANLYDPIVIYLGYAGSTSVVFTGVIKRIEKAYPTGMVNVTCYDVLTRASDYFIVSDEGADHPITYQDKSIEYVINDLLTMSGITNLYVPVPTAFTIATGGSKLEINLQIAYDACKQLSDLIAWDLWADHNGAVLLKNRKPYPMYGTSMQPGDSLPAHADVPIKTITTADILTLNIGKTERELRNRVVVYGAKNMVKDAFSATSYDPVADADLQILPVGFYKSVVLSSAIITDATFAQQACDYNLALLNRVQYEISLTVVGDPIYHARNTVTITYAPLNISGQWYIYQCDHNFGKNGYTCDLVLRK